MIPQDKIDDYVAMLFGQSEPGQALHNLLVATAEADAGALGVPDLDVAIYALAPVGTTEVNTFISKAIMGAAVEARKRNAVVHFAGLAMEVFGVNGFLDGESRKLARRLLAEGRLREHPDAAEITKLYAACRDGRRWIGEHVLTGPHAGNISGPTVRVGTLASMEREEPWRLIRGMVGL